MSDTEKVLKEIKYNLKIANEILQLTDDDNNEKERERHLIALGEIMALNNIKYSISNKNWQYEKENK